MKKVLKITEPKKIYERSETKVLNVAAYARVSKESYDMKNSLTNQVSYYSELIAKTKNWRFVGIYADYGTTGTKVSRREEFRRLIDDCRNHKIDLVLTKSIQRFARNTVDLLSTIRELKSLGVEVRFEKENISTFSEEGEFALSLFATMAQEESRSISNNIKWTVRKRFEEGRTFCKKRFLGYKWVDDELVIIDREAEIVKFIYDRFLKGDNFAEISRTLKENKMHSYLGNNIDATGVKRILTNDSYKGTLTLQKFYIGDPITKKRYTNNGLVRKYEVENNHTPIISSEIFKEVNERINRRKNRYASKNF